jgi:hydrogenase nickel incorporation protein HypB
MKCSHGPDPTRDAEQEQDPEQEQDGMSGTEPEGRRMVLVREAVLSKNDRAAAELRGEFARLGLGVFNLLSSPGSGKTTLLQTTLKRLQPETRAGVIVGDLATDNDARRLNETGAPVVQIETGGLCHLEADMVARAARVLGLDGLDLLFIENVGNLVCPAGYDLGEAVRVVLLSVTEGEDKPLKYPTAFQKADAVVVSKIDMAEAAGFDRAAALADIRAIAPTARIFELSSRTGAGIDAWCDYLRSAGRPAAVSEK